MNIPSLVSGGVLRSDQWSNRCRWGRLPWAAPIGSDVWSSCFANCRKRMDKQWYLSYWRFHDREAMTWGRNFSQSRCKLHPQTTSRQTTEVRFNLTDQKEYPKILWQMSAKASGRDEPIMSQVTHPSPKPQKYKNNLVTDDPAQHTL